MVISVQHDDGVSLEEQRKVLKDEVIKAVVPSKYLDENTIYHLQPSGRFVIGGPQVKVLDVTVTSPSSAGASCCRAPAEAAV